MRDKFDQIKSEADALSNEELISLEDYVSNKLYQREFPKDWSIEERFSFVTLSLLTESSNLKFLESLFSRPSGEWLSVSYILQNHSKLAKEITDVEQLIQDKLRVTWLGYPDVNDDFCIIIFFVEAILWHDFAFFNKKLFLDRLAENL